VNIGLISDIHANAANLRLALALLREQGADVILCAGDLVDGASEGDAAAQGVKAAQIPCVQGNRDFALSRGHHASPRLAAHDDLSDDTLSFLRDLPLTRRVEHGGKRFLLAHASPWDQATYVFPNSRPALFEQLAADAHADVVVLGHTHTPMAVEVNGVLVLNPGSVDANRHAPYPSTCALLSFPVTRYRVFDIKTGSPVQYPFIRLDDLGTNLHHSQGS
jgi:putative phosphoesterase